MFLGTDESLNNIPYISPLYDPEEKITMAFPSQIKKEKTPLDDLLQKLCDHLKLQSNHHTPILHLLQQHRDLFDTSRMKTIVTNIHHVINTGNNPPVNAKPYFKSVEQRKDIQQKN